MVLKNKNSNGSASTLLANAAKQAGTVLMAAAITVGMLEMPDHSNSKIIVPNQPAFAFAGESSDANNNSMRREREETAPHFISYSETQRTASRSGTQ